MSPCCGFIRALATGDSQLTWPQSRSASSTPTIVIVILVPRPVAEGDGRAEKDLVQLLLLVWVDHLGTL